MYLAAADLIRSYSTAVIYRPSSYKRGCRDRYRVMGLLTFKLAPIRHYFEAAQAMSPTAVGNGTLP